MAQGLQCQQEGRCPGDRGPLQPQSLPLRAELVLGICGTTHPVVLIGCHSCELGLREDKGLEVFLGIAGAVLAWVHEDHVETGLITMHGVEDDLQEGESQVQGWSWCSHPPWAHLRHLALWDNLPTTGLSSPTGSLLEVSQLTPCFLASGPLPRLSAKLQTASPLTSSSSLSSFRHPCRYPTSPASSSSRLYHNPGPTRLQPAQPLPVTAYRLVPHVAIVVHQVVGQLEFVKGHNLPHPLGTLGWRVRVEVHPARRGRVGLACHQPGGTVEGIPGGSRGRSQGLSLPYSVPCLSKVIVKTLILSPVMLSLPGGHHLFFNCICLRIARSLFLLPKTCCSRLGSPGMVSEGLHVTLSALRGKFLFSALLLPCCSLTCISCHPTG